MNSNLIEKLFGKYKKQLLYNYLWYFNNIQNNFILEKDILN